MLNGLSQKAEHKDKDMDKKGEELGKLDAQSQSFSIHLLEIPEGKSWKKMTVSGRISGLGWGEYFLPELNLWIGLASWVPSIIYEKRLT